MKAKLVKRSNGRFDLYSIEDKNQINTIASSFDNPIGKLSLKNCQSIERGYDLDELAEQEFPYDFDCPLFETLGITEKSHKSILIGMLQGTLQKGFQKALELMGDKKFSEDDVRKVIEIARNGSMQEQHNGYGRPTELRFVLDNVSSDDIIQSLQQTEWDVEVEMENVYSVNNGENEMMPKLRPVFDADGCLILKRINL